MKALEKLINEHFKKSPDKVTFINELREFINSISTMKDEPVDLVRWVPWEKIEANDYNPNSVALKEMSLLKVSINHDGYTQPLVTVYDPEKDKYIIVDGFHRYHIGVRSKAIREKLDGHLPIVVLNKGMNERMASTIRHNRARGEHSVAGMSSMVYKMLKNGWKDSDICNELGMEPEELLRLKHITGYSKLFKNMEFKKAWKGPKQIKLEKEHGVLGTAK